MPSFKAISYTPRTPLDLPDTLRARDERTWRTIDLTPGTLFHLPPRTPHRVVCHGRSLAISLTWTCARARARRIPALAAWDVVDGSAETIPRQAHDRLWVQVPVVAGPGDRRRGEFALWTADGEAARLPARLRPWATGLTVMPWLRARDIPAPARQLLNTGILAPVDLLLVVRPERPRALDGWRFA